MKNIICHAEEFGSSPECSVKTWMGMKLSSNIIM